MYRLPFATIAAALALVGCSGGADEPAAVTTTVPATTAPARDEPETDPADAAIMAAGPDLPEWTVAIDVTAEGFDGRPVDTAVMWSGDPDTVVADGPFGEYASCSGLFDEVGAYSVFVSGHDSLDVVAVWTAARITGPGIYDAEVRIELGGQGPVTASGTMTLLPDLQQGSFLAFGPAGGRVEGTFTCAGADPTTPITSDRDVMSDVLEVFAVLRQGDAERIVGLAVSTDDADGVTATCRGGDDLVLAVDGDAGAGAITLFELDAELAVARLRVAGVDYEFREMALAVDGASGASGAFSSATVDGVTVDGAFRCA